MCVYMKQPRGQCHLDFSSFSDPVASLECPTWAVPHENHRFKEPYYS